MDLEKQVSGEYHGLTTVSIPIETDRLWVSAVKDQPTFLSILELVKFAQKSGPLAQALKSCWASITALFRPRSHKARDSKRSGVSP